MIKDFFADTVVHLELQILYLKKVWNGPNGILRGLEESDSEVENLVTLTL